MSLLATTRNGKTFEKADSGMYHGILADIQDLGPVTTTYQGISKTQEMVRFIWVLDKSGKEGPLTVSQKLGKNLHEKSNLYKTVKQILNAAPPLQLDLETLVGSVRQLLVVRETSGTPGTQDFKDFSNVQGIVPAQAGVTVALPQGFLRDKSKPADQQVRNKKKNPTFGQQAGQQQAQPSLQAQGPAPATQQGPDLAF
jgi:hypothetical protein